MVIDELSGVVQDRQALGNEAGESLSQISREFTEEKRMVRPNEPSRPPALKEKIASARSNRGKLLVHAMDLESGTQSCQDAWDGHREVWKQVRAVISEDRPKRWR